MPYRRHGMTRINVDSVQLCVYASPSICVFVSLWVFAISRKMLMSDKWHHIRICTFYTQCFIPFSPFRTLALYSRRHSHRFSLTPYASCFVLSWHNETMINCASLEHKRKYNPSSTWCYIYRYTGGILIWYYKTDNHRDIQLQTRSIASDMSLFPAFSITKR